MIILYGILALLCSQMTCAMKNTDCAVGSAVDFLLKKRTIMDANNMSDSSSSTQINVTWNDESDIKNVAKGMVLERTIFADSGIFQSYAQLQNKKPINLSTIRLGNVSSTTIALRLAEALAATNDEQKAAIMDKVNQLPPIDMLVAGQEQLKSSSSALESLKRFLGFSSENHQSASEFFKHKLVELLDPKYEKANQNAVNAHFKKLRFPERSSSKWLMIGGGTALALIVGLTAWWYNSQSAHA